ncbi:hypothetical protein R6Q57_003347 [Mikania cordata]
MPTPVNLVRQYLTETAARALDDAVSVAHKRSHSQTTSLHVVWVLLSSSTSTLRDACARTRSRAYSARLQYRALELCINVSLDRMPSSKTKILDDEPPVSNSLMAAIKRSQANQRRHPETFHLYQMHQQLHGSQPSLSCVKVELKHFILSILDDPVVSRVFGDAGFRSTDIKIAMLNPPSVYSFQKSLSFPVHFNINRCGINFPFAVDQGEEDFKRIGSVLMKKTSRNPLLIGVSAHTVLTGFTESLKIGKVGFLAAEIEGLNVINIDKQIHEYVLGDSSEDMMNLKLQEVRDRAESCRSCGLIVNLGELRLVLDDGSTDRFVSELSDLVRTCGGKLWLIGSVGSYDVYMKMLVKFPNLERDWDLNLLPITCSRLDTDRSQLQFQLPLPSSFTRSFVNESSKHDRSSSCCDACNEKYEQEVSVIMNGDASVAVADQQSKGLTSWLQVSESDSNKGNNIIECRLNSKDQSGFLKARVMGLQRKWADICYRLHHKPLPTTDASEIWARFPFTHHSQPGPTSAKPSWKDSNHEMRCRNLSPTTSLTSGLGLGTIYVSPDTDTRPAGHETRLQPVNGWPGSRDRDGTSNHISNEKDFKQLYLALADKVGYQNDSIWAISQAITRVRTGSQRRHVWFMFSGPDPVGQKKICTTLAEVVLGNPESLISIDLNFENQVHHPGSVFNRQNVNFTDPDFRGKTVTEFIAEQLNKKSGSVVLLEHIDKADFLTKDNLYRAMKTGKLTDACGRETRITDAIFVCTTSCSKDESGKDLLTYSEERILNAKALQMRISVRKTAPESSSVVLSPKDSSSRNIEISKKRKIIETGSFEIIVPTFKKPRACFDLNVPLEEIEESDNETDSEPKESWLEEFSDQVDEKVIFEPFDFDSRAEAILKEICICFERSFGSRVGLEIENAVMVQILASCWLSDGNQGVENWIETVLCRGFMEVEKEQDVESGSMVKLEAIEGVKIEDDDALCVCLPKRIMIK